MWSRTFIVGQSTTIAWAATTKLCTRWRLLLPGNLNWIFNFIFFCILIEKIVTNCNAIVIAGLIMDSISSYVELVEPQSYSKGHKSSSAYTTSFKIVAEGLRS